MLKLFNLNLPAGGMFFYCLFYWQPVIKNAVVLAGVFFMVLRVQAAQPDSNLVLTFNFNSHNFNEANNLVPTKPVGALLVEDRFGNSRSALFLSGNKYSYLELAASPLLKAPVTTISLWVNIGDRVFAGRGYDMNPIYITKNGPGEDFIFAYQIGLHGGTGRFIACSARDSLEEAILTSINKAEFGRWYHLAIVGTGSLFSFYVNGKFQGSCHKRFTTHFLPESPVWIGGTGSYKNERFFLGSIDDIQVFHRALTESEILELYHAPNPNRLRAVMRQVFKWLAVAAGIFVTAFLLVWRRRRALRQAREKLDLNRRLHETEIRTLKAQMNPHFIFNALNGIQQFIMQHNYREAERYLSKFSKLLRELLETNTRENLTLQEEISILTGYLEMEALRFSGSFSFTVEADAALPQEQIHIPHLLVQPFAENAVWHGLLNKKGNRMLRISFHAHTGCALRCEVYDNGVGRVAVMQRETALRKKSLALSLVRQRLDLLGQNAGQSCGVSFTDHAGENGAPGGTTVTIILPILKP